jgi:Primase C terminal 2 (PriCT-2)/Family of unknown function (DUF5906)
MTIDLAQARTFLAAVLPWDGMSYGNIHWTKPSSNGDRPYWDGRACRFVDEAVRTLDWILGLEDARDIYFCTSTQRNAEEKVSQKGHKYLKAIRNQPNAVALKALFIDVDGYKEDSETGYPTMGEGAAALSKFIADVGLPNPSILVKSGGGIHTYWLVDRALTPGEWQPLANALQAAIKQHGLKCDSGCTVDSARVLRVPCTFNKKTDPPLPVTLVGNPADRVYTVECLEQVLEPYKVAAKPHGVNGFVVDHSLFPPPGPTQEGGELAAGVEALDSVMTPGELRACLDAISNPASTDWAEWNKVGMTIYAACDGADYGLEEWERWSAKHPNYGADEKDSCAARWKAYDGSPPTNLSGGSLVHRAREATGNRTWVPPRAGSISGATEAHITSVPALPPDQRKPLKGGIYSPAEALPLMNSQYFIGATDQETGIFRIKDDGSPVFVPPEQFKLEVANIFVKFAKPIPAEKYWKEHPHRHQRKIVFKPGGTTEPDELNLWQGYGVAPRKTRRKVRSLLRHIWRVLCRRDKEKFKYVIRWLAWAVQHPDKHPGVVIVLKSRMQGTGKSTLGVVLLRIFGPHGALVDDKDRLLGRFNDWLEPVCFILAEEILWAGDHRANDKLKSLITADTIQIERKFGGCRSIPNRLHVIMTTNHDHAVAAGVGDRRFVVLDVSSEHAGDKAYFDRLYQDWTRAGQASSWIFYRT